MVSWGKIAQHYSLFFNTFSLKQLWIIRIPPPPSNIIVIAASQWSKQQCARIQNKTKLVTSLIKLKNKKCGYGCQGLSSIAIDYCHFKKCLNKPTISALAVFCLLYFIGVLRLLSTCKKHFLFMMFGRRLDVHPTGKNAYMITK